MADTTLPPARTDLRLRAPHEGPHVPRPVVPAALPPDPVELARLTDLLRGGGVTVLTGAGMSTPSGIPDYRGPDGVQKATPMTYQQFIGSPEARQRYWARSFIGWRRFRAAQPNASHRLVTRLQEEGLVGTVVTQNVDGLHQAAGTREVVELHGSLDRVVCLTCGETTSRLALDDRLREANPEFTASAGELRPDGDVVLPDEEVARFIVGRCLVCGSDMLKPDVVFFGESVPKPLVESVFATVEASRALLVLGSSLKVMSGYRFVRRAARLGIPVAVVTRGWTRATEETDIRLDALVEPVLAAALDALGHND